MYFLREQYFDKFFDMHFLREKFWKFTLRGCNFEGEIFENILLST